MNNQMPYGFMPQFGNQGQGQNCHCNNQLRTINERIDSLERQVRRLERRVSNLENSAQPFRPAPISNTLNDEQYQNNYMI